MLEGFRDYDDTSPLQLVPLLERFREVFFYVGCHRSGIGQKFRNTFMAEEENRFFLLFFTGAVMPHLLRFCFHMIHSQISWPRYLTVGKPDSNPGQLRPMSGVAQLPYLTVPPHPRVKFFKINLSK
jgi:hypothetical protein